MAYPADSMSVMNPPDVIDDLRAMTRDLRAQLVRHVAAGAWAAPGGATARSVIVPFDVPVGDVVDDEPSEHGRRSLAQIRADVGECTRCKLSTTRKSIVFGVGDPRAPLM